MVKYYTRRLRFPGPDAALRWLVLPCVRSSQPRMAVPRNGARRWRRVRVSRLRASARVFLVGVDLCWLSVPRDGPTHRKRRPMTRPVAWLVVAVFTAALVVAVAVAVWPVVDQMTGTAQIEEEP